MPWMTRSILFALYAATFIISSSISRSAPCAMASPFDTRLVAPRAAPGFSHLNTSTLQTSGLSFKDAKINRDVLTLLTRSKSPRTVIVKALSAAADRPLYRRDDYSNLYAVYQRASDHSSNLKQLAARSTSVDANDADFQKDCATQLTAFSDSFLELQTGMNALGSDKGLKNYDRTNDLETLLKNTVNLNKETLKCVYILVANIPVLGPLLGPIVYDIKCLLDEVLNLCENLTDGVINALQPLLHAVIGSAITLSCRSGAEIAGICI